MAPKTIVFIDYQNAHLSAHEKYCAPGSRPRDCQIDPVKLAELVVSKRAPGGELAQIRVYRGRPDPRKQPKAAAANDRQFHAWSQDHRVLTKRRALWYPRNFGIPECTDAPREKGVDVSLAIDMVRLAYEKKYEVGILFSRDNDLLPPLEMLRDLKLANVETATWKGASKLSLPGLRRHLLDESDFLAVRDLRDYSAL